MELGKAEFNGNPVEVIDGLLGDVNVESVDLQHVARRLWIGKVLDSMSNL